MNEVIYLDPSDPHSYLRLQSPRRRAAADRATATANIVSAFKNIWSESWGPRLEYILTNSLAAAARHQRSKPARATPPSCSMTAIVTGL